jgi:nicotinic acid mononucleotide adenylyltransferase
MNHPIERLSNASTYRNTHASGLVMVGSYAPVHEGHFDAMRSAERRLLIEDDDIAGNVFAPNSDSYVLKKLHDTHGIWNFGRRVNEFTARGSGTSSRSYVDDITGLIPPELSISEEVIETVSHRLGIKACNLVLVVGTDQISSMQSHLDYNRAICVLRPGSEGILQNVITKDWFNEATSENRLLLTSRENIKVDISSTEIRNQLEVLER